MIRCIVPNPAVASSGCVLFWLRAAGNVRTDSVIPGSEDSSPRCCLPVNFPETCENLMTSPPVLSCSQVRQLDQLAIEHFGVPGLLLMENAGRGCAELLLQQQPGDTIIICCGRGNNGGDGFVIARHLLLAGLSPRIVLCGAADQLQGDAAVNCRIAQQLQIPMRSISETELSVELQHELSESLQGADWIVDALLGTGTKGAARGATALLIELINAAGRPVLAIDLPSGLDGDTGEVQGNCIRAKLTATLAAVKPGLLQSAAAGYVGELKLVPIGIPVDPLLSLLQMRQSESNSCGPG